VRASLVAVLVAAGLAAAGCGGGSSPGGGTEAAANGEVSKPAQQVFADAVKAAKAATTGHMSGHINRFPNEVSIDATFVKGKGAFATIVDNGRNVDVVVIGDPLGPQPTGGKLYLRGSSAWWSYYGTYSGIKDRSSLGGKWVEISVTDYTAFAAFEGWAEYADLNSVLDLLTSYMGALTKESLTYKGQSVVALYGRLKIRSLFVAGTGTAYPVVAAIKDPSGAAGDASISFDSWGKPFSVSAPSVAIEVSKLAG
jgi:hypothetical protein